MIVFPLDISQIEIDATTILAGDTPVSAADVLRIILEAVPDSGLAFGTNLFVGEEPASPPSTTTLYDKGGTPISANDAIDEEMIQVRCRSKTYKEGMAQMQEIKLVLESLPSLTIGDRKIVGVWVLSTPTFIGKDKRDLRLFTMSLKTIHQPTNQGNRTL